MTEAVDEEGSGGWVAYLFFLRWQGAEPIGHAETEVLVEAGSEVEARTAVEVLTLREVKEMLDRLVIE
jgi:hypothetical protein